MTAGSFDFTTAGHIIVGPGRVADLPGVLAGLGSQVLVCTGADPSRHAGLLAGIGLPAAVFPVPGEPTVELARAAVAAAREHGADVIAAIGGGSVIDTGKAVAMLLGNGGDPLDYLEVVGSGRPITRPAAPCVAVPTTAGTGAEVTANAVLAVPEHQLKAIACAAALAPVVEANVRALRSGPASADRDALDRYTEAARLLTGDPTASIGDGLAWIRETLALLEVPGLAAFGVGPQHADDIAAKALTSSSMQGNPVALSHDDLRAILLQAL